MLVLDINTQMLFLHAHSTLRWAILALAAITIVKSIAGMNGEYAKPDNILAASFVGLMHLQFLLGLVMYVFISPVTRAAFDDFGAAMGNGAIRFWAVEHIAAMTLAVVFAQVGRSKAKKKTDSKAKFKIQAIFFAISLALMLAGMPWDRLFA